MKKVAFFDIDGTLLDCMNGIDRITNRVKKSIKEFQKCGNYAFIASGRPYAFIVDEILNFGFDGYLLVNGANVLINDELIYSKPMNKDDIKKFIADFERLNIQYILQGKKYSYLKDEYKDLYLYYSKHGISKKYIQSEYDIENIDVYKIDMLCKSKEAVDYCLTLKADDYISYHDKHYQKKDIDVFFLNLKMESKGNAVKKVIEYLDIDVKNSYAFGDEKNDIEMLDFVGCGIAMGNASEYVKKYADKVTETVNNDGVAIGIKNYIL